MHDINSNTEVMSQKPVVMSGYTYYEFLILINKLVANESTSGPDQTPMLIKITHLNKARMRRLDKQTVIIPELKQAVENIDTGMIWLVLVEAWCGDGAQNLPVINKVASLSPFIELRILLRDEHPDLMDQYLTDGKRSIPKLVMFKADTMEELASWGSRPLPLQKLVKAEKERGLDKESLSEEIHKWYARDKGNTLQKELLRILNNLSTH